MMRINYFVATVRTKYEYLLHSHALAKHVSHVFDIALPAGVVTAVPFIGLILDNFSTTFVLGLLVVIATIIGVTIQLGSIHEHCIIRFILSSVHHSHIRLYGKGFLDSTRLAKSMVSWFASREPWTYCKLHWMWRHTKSFMATRFRSVSLCLQLSYW